MRNTLILLTTLMTFPPVCGLSQTPSHPLTLEDCLLLTESVPSAVSIAGQEREIVAREATQAKAAFLPQTRVLSGVTYNSPNLQDRERFSFIALNGIREYVGLLSISQELDTSGRLRSDLARAHANRDAASAGLVLTRRDLRRSVTAAYYTALFTRRVVSIVQDALEESKRFEQRTKLLFEGGEAARADVVKASAQVAVWQRRLNAAELDAQLANQDLASFWTRDVATQLPLVDVMEQPLPEPQEPAGGGAPFLRRPEFNLLEAQRRGFQADVKRARADLLPRLSLVFQYGIDSYWVRANERGYAAFANLDIPVFDWMRARSAMKQAQLRTQQVDAGRAVAERTFSRDYQNALARVKQLFEQIALAHEQAALAGEDLRLSRLRYEGGEGSALDVVTAQIQLADARTGYYTAVMEYLNARADLEVASGR